MEKRELLFPKVYDSSRIPTFEDIEIISNLVKEKFIEEFSFLFDKMKKYFPMKTKIELRSNGKDASIYLHTDTLRYKTVREIYGDSSHMQLDIEKDFYGYELVKGKWVLLTECKIKRVLDRLKRNKDKSKIIVNLKKYSTKESIQQEEWRKKLYKDLRGAIEIYLQGLDPYTAEDIYTLFGTPLELTEVFSQFNSL